jgi:hypothetical protein
MLTLALIVCSQNGGLHIYYLGRASIIRLKCPKEVTQQSITSSTNNGTGLVHHPVEIPPHLVFTDISTPEAMTLIDLFPWGELSTTKIKTKFD